MRSRAVRFVTFFGVHANIILTGVLFFVLLLAFANIYAWLEYRQQSNRLSGIEIARIVEERAANASRVADCRRSIPTIRTANVLITTVKDDLLERAKRAELRADAEIDPFLKHTAIADTRELRRKANALRIIPQVTREQCDFLELRLEDALQEKYAERLQELKEQEKQSEKDDN